MNTQINARGGAGVNTPIVPTPEQTATPPGLAHGAGSALQLPLGFSEGNPDAPLRVAPDLLYDAPGQRWRCIDEYTGRSFGGSFSDPEVDFISAHFRDWSGAISPGQFEVVAEQAIAACRAGARGVAA
ncbi:hypothetical protein [Nodosilinea sp. FACHB-13]|uniref:hypothetical protein n=1 Tax=Cyanophyceae TaxID=3028117 RepID=UPI001682726E|nr:hypothetical protein [Nodosilinea sp. FACHB-13]MBD2106710.1 hypothetical protein [Nodosilinea sp. FACHB-13]